MVIFSHLRDCENFWFKMSCIILQQISLCLFCRMKLCALCPPTHHQTRLHYIFKRFLFLRPWEGTGVFLPQSLIDIKVVRLHEDRTTLSERDHSDGRKWGFGGALTSILTSYSEARLTTYTIPHYSPLANVLAEQHNCIEKYKLNNSPV